MNGGRDDGFLSLEAYTVVAQKTRTARNIKLWIFSRIDDSQLQPAGSIPSRSFQKLQRIWNDRQHAISVNIPESPTVAAADQHSMFPLQESVEEDFDRRAPLHDLDIPQLEINVDTDPVPTSQEEKQDKENHDPDSSVRTTALVFCDILIPAAVLRCVTAAGYERVLQNECIHELEDCSQRA